MIAFREKNNQQSISFYNTLGIPGRPTGFLGVSIPRSFGGRQIISHKKTRGASSLVTNAPRAFQFQR